MYKLPYFTEHNKDEVLQFMQAHPFVTLIGHDGTKNVATQIPVLIEEKGDKLFFLAHIMRNTDHYKAIVAQPEVLILFQGPHCYVSSSWYAQKMGATWNYQTVHVRGNCSILNDEQTIDLLTKLTAHFEKHQETPLLVPDLPDGYMEAHVKAIAGLEIEVTDIYPIFKLSQNRDDASYQNIVSHLNTTTDIDAHKIADEMVLRRPHLFK